MDRTPVPHRPIVIPMTIDRTRPSVVSLRCPCGWDRIWSHFDPTPTELLEAEQAHRAEAG